VRDLQVRMRQLAWYSGRITGTYDSQTVTGVKGFQGKRGFPVTGEVDQRTLDRPQVDDPYAHGRREEQRHSGGHGDRWRSTRAA